MKKFLLSFFLGICLVATPTLAVETYRNFDDLLEQLLVMKLEQKIQEVELGGGYRTQRGPLTIDSAGGASDFPFTQTIHWGVNTSATSTPLWLQNGLYVSSTSWLSTVSTSLIEPYTNNTYNLGSYGAAWKNLYVSSTAYLGGAPGVNQLVVGSSTPYLIVDNGGKIGIGTGPPVTTLLHKLNIGNGTNFIAFESSPGVPYAGYGWDETLDALVLKTNTGGADLNYNAMIVKRISGDIFASGTVYLGGEAGVNQLVVGSSTPYLIVDESGDVGIGIANPLYNLDVFSANEASVRIGNGSGNVIISADGDGTTLATASWDLRLSAGGSTRMTVNAGGNITLATNLIPDANNTLNLGAYGSAWNNIYSSSTAYLSYVSSTAMDLGKLTLSSALLPSGNNTVDIGAYGTAMQDIFASGTIYAGGGLAANSAALDFTGNPTNKIDFGGRTTSIPSSEEGWAIRLWGTGTYNASDYGWGMGTGEQWFNVGSGGVIGFRINSTQIAKISATGILSTTNNTSNLGAFGNAWKDIFTSGTIYIATKSCSLGLTTDANGGINGCVSSDRSLKTNIKPLSEVVSGDIIENLKPVFYNWKSGGQTHAGFIAQDVEDVFPEAVVLAGEGLKGVDSNAILAALVDKVQEQQKQIDALLRNSTPSASWWDNFINWIFN